MQFSDYYFKKLGFIETLGTYWWLRRVPLGSHMHSNRSIIHLKFFNAQIELTHTSFLKSNICRYWLIEKSQREHFPLCFVPREGDMFWKTFHSIILISRMPFDNFNLTFYRWEQIAVLLLFPTIYLHSRLAMLKLYRAAITAIEQIAVFFCNSIQFIYILDLQC